MTNYKAYIDTMKNIPAMPNIIVKALGMMKKETTGLKDLSNMISYDQALCTEVLKIVNSAYYGFAQQVTSVERALPLLGMEQSKNIIVAVAMKPMFTAAGAKELWKHSLKCAVGCEFLASKMKGIEPSEAFVIGFLHDIGKIVFTIADKVTYEKVKDVTAKGVNVIEAEEHLMGNNHAEVGAILAKKWQLPVLLTNCIKYHHEPKESQFPEIVYMLYAVDRLVQDEVDEELIFEPEIWNDSPLSIASPVEMRDTILAKSEILLRQLGM